MKLIMKCSIILKNIVIEECMFAECEEDDGIKDGVVVWEGQTQVLGGLEHLHEAVTEAAKE